MFKKIIYHFKGIDWLLAISFFSLVVIGLCSIYSSSFRNGDFMNFKKQIAFFVIGIFIMFAVSFFDYRVLRNNSYLILTLYTFCLMLLGGLFFFGTEIRGVHRWYKIGSYSFDPKIITTIILIILLAKYFSMRHVEMYKFQHIIFSGFYLVIPSILIFLQPELGWVLILIATWIGVLVVSGIKVRHFLILLLCGILILALGWQFFLKDYQKQRVIGFVMPYDPLGVSWSQNQSKIAIGSASFLGKGLKQGSQTQYGFLPEPQTDFIFAAIAEEIGLLGVMVLFSLFSLFLYRVIKIARISLTNFSRLFSLGFAIFIFFQFFVNVGMNVGILPIVGVPMPLVSYGGSSLVSICAGLGILQSIYIRTRG